MDTFFERYKNLLVLIAVLLVQFIGLAMQVRTPVGASGKGVHLLRYWIVALAAPPEKAVVHTGSGVRGFWGNYIDLRHTRDENEQLREENNRLRLEQAGLLEDARQGQRLQALLRFQEHYLYQTVPAQVIGTGGSDQSRVLLIDKGSNDGVKVDQPVITPDGIVGKVRDVFPRTAQILEINDQTSGAGVLLQTTRLRGVLRGNAYGQPQVIDILPDERIKAGEQVVTSGGDQIFPRGLPVGVVEKVVADPEREPYEDIVIRPAANLQHLEEVLVVTQTSDELPAKVQKDLARSEAVGAAETEKQRASDILADRLPSIIDPNNPDDKASNEQKPSGGEEVGRPIQPPLPQHADRYSPDSTPPANQLTPGKAALTAASTHAAATPDATDHPAAKPRVKAPIQAGSQNAAAPAVNADGANASATATPKKRVAPAPTDATNTGAAATPASRTVETTNTAPPHSAENKTQATRPAPATTAAYVEPKWVGRRETVRDTNRDANQDTSHAASTQEPQR